MRGTGPYRHHTSLALHPAYALWQQGDLRLQLKPDLVSSRHRQARRSAGQASSSSTTGA